MTNLTPPKTTPPTRLGRLEALFASSALVGAVGVFGFILSLGLLLAPVVRTLFASYNVEIERPDLVNLYCEGSEGIDASDIWDCYGPTNVTMVATPLFYKNESSNQKAVWLRREIVRVEFRGKNGEPITEIALTAN